MSTEQQGGNAFPHACLSAWSRESIKSREKVDAGVQGSQKPLAATEDGRLGKKELSLLSSPLASFIPQRGYYGPVAWTHESQFLE